MTAFLASFSTWFNSRKTKSMLVGVLAALSGHLTGAITPEQAMNAILIVVVANILGVAAEDMAAKMGSAVITGPLDVKKPR